MLALVTLSGTTLTVATALDVFVMGGLSALGRQFPAWATDATVASYIVMAVFGAIGLGQSVQIVQQARASARARKGSAS